MEVVYYAARANLRRLMGLYPQWTHQQYAQAVGMSLGWVKKWKKRLQEADPEDTQVLHSRSRARKHPPERISEPVVERIIQMRDSPPEGLQRTPGPKAQYISLKPKRGKDKTRKLQIWQTTRKQKNKELSDVQITAHGRR